MVYQSVSDLGCGHAGRTDLKRNAPGDRQRTKAPGYPASRDVNNVRNESPDLINRAGANEGGSAPAPMERELF